MTAFSFQNLQYPLYFTRQTFQINGGKVLLFLVSIIVRCTDRILNCLQKYKNAKKDFTPLCQQCQSQMPCNKWNFQRNSSKQRMINVGAYSDTLGLRDYPHILRHLVHFSLFSILHISLMAHHSSMSDLQISIFLYMEFHREFQTENGGRNRCT